MADTIDVWFNSLGRLESVLIGTLFFYFFTVVLIRISGKRTVGQMNNFDWIMTVAIGSLVGSGILLENVSIADAATAIVCLTALQWITVWLSVKYSFVEGLIVPKPRLLTHKGRVLEEALRQTRVSKNELFMALREKGFTSLDDANWVILENNGQMTVIPRQEIAIHNSEVINSVKHNIENDSAD